MKHAAALLLILVALVCVFWFGGWRAHNKITDNGPLSQSAADGLSPPADPRPIEWGVYQIYWGRRFPGALQASIDSLQATPDYVMIYRDLRSLRRYPEGAFSVIREHGAVPIVSLELWSWGDGGTDYLSLINGGKFDDLFRNWANGAAEDGRRLLLRFGFEFNGDWFTWSGRPGAFAEAWRRAHTIFQEAGATNVEWVWCPNVTSHPTTPENDMHLYWPGDEYVDWVGLDGYNWGDDHDEWHRWSSFEEVFGRPLDQFAERYPDKPIIIGEFASVPGQPGQQAAWIRDAYRSIQKRPAIRAAVWFNFDKRREGEYDWRLDTDPESLQAFQETFAVHSIILPEPETQP